MEPVRGKYIVMHPYKRSGTALVWPMENFQALARQLSESKLKIIVIGDRDDSDVLHSYFGSIPQVEIHCELSLVQTAALLRGAFHFFGNSSGPLHLAALVGTPHTGFYPQNKSAAPRRWRTLPLAGAPRLSEHLLSTDFPVGCVECRLKSCEFFPCTQKISVDTAIASMKFWKRSPARHAAARSIKKTSRKRKKEVRKS